MENSTYAIVLLDTVEKGAFKLLYFVEVEISFSIIENLNMSSSKMKKNVIH